MNVDNPSFLRDLCERIEPGGQLLGSRPLPGGISYATVALQIRCADGRLRDCVARAAGDEMLANHPGCVEDEFRLLALTRGHGLPVPEPLLLHREEPTAPADCMLIEFVDAVPAVRPRDPVDCACQFATHLHAIHRVNAANADLEWLPDWHGAFRPWLETRVESRVESRLESEPIKLDVSLNEATILDALRDCVPAVPYPNGVALLHGDFWPGNVLWRDEQIVAIIDWEDAARGDPMIDVAITRLDLLWCFGPGAMNAFTDAYAAASGFDLGDLAYWDLCAAMRPVGALSIWAEGWPAMGRDDVTKARLIAGHEAFVNSALHRL